MKVIVRAMEEGDLPEADHVFRLAFGTFLRMPEPERFGGDLEFHRPRFRADPSAAFVAERAGEVVGSNFATGWGSVGFFGPLSVRPDLWNGGIGQSLVVRALERFEAWGTRHTGLFTFADSAKHLALYRRFDFHPRSLTAILSAALPGKDQIPPQDPPLPPQRYSELRPAERATALAECRELADQIYPGLDLTPEISAVARFGFGDTLLLPDACGLGGFAICHCGPGTEAGSGACFVKFGCVLPGAGASQRFEGLLATCEAFAALQGLGRVVAGVSTARSEAYGRMLNRGFTTFLQGVAMHRPNEAGYHRPDALVMDDWR